MAHSLPTPNLVYIKCVYKMTDDWFFYINNIVNAKLIGQCLTIYYVEIVEYWRVSLWCQESELEVNDWRFYLDPILVHKMSFVLFLTKNDSTQTTTYICL